jgi:hypothetical protein
MKLYTYEVEYKVTGHVSACDMDDAHGEADSIKEMLYQVYSVDKVEFKVKEIGE